MPESQERKTKIGMDKGDNVHSFIDAVEEQFGVLCSQANLFQRNQQRHMVMKG